MENLSIKEIKEELEKRGISQSKVAKELDYDKDYINRILNEREKASTKLITKFNIYLNL